MAGRLRLLLDEHTATPLTLDRAAAQLERSVPHLVRSFTQRYGVGHHAYVVGRRVEHARRRLLRGERPADVATAVGVLRPGPPDPAPQAARLDDPGPLRRRGAVGGTGRLHRRR